MVVVAVRIASHRNNNWLLLCESIILSTYCGVLIICRKGKGMGWDGLEVKFCRNVSDSSRSVSIWHSPSHQPRQALCGMDSDKASTSLEACLSDRVSSDANDPV